MPRDLFGDVTRPSISIGNRKWYTVPVSLLSHSIIIAMVVVLPILAAPLMPRCARTTTISIHHDRSFRRRPRHRQHVWRERQRHR